MSSCVHCRERGVVGCTPSSCPAADPSRPWQEQEADLPCWECWRLLGGLALHGRPGELPPSGRVTRPAPALVLCPSCPGGVRFKVHAGMRAEDMVRLLKGPVPSPTWPDGWETWPVTAEAHRTLLEEFLASDVEPDPVARSGRGVVTVAGGEKFLLAAWVMIRVLRHVGCQLPVEVWHLGPAEMPAHAREAFRSLGADTRDLLALPPRRNMGGWEGKAQALLHCRFEEALYLDADQVPARNPEHLFDGLAYRGAGLLAWPDYPSAGWTITGQGFQAAGLPTPGWSRLPSWPLPADYDPLESGQLLVDLRRRRRDVLAWRFLNDHAEFWYRGCKERRGVNNVYGDKDTLYFALARCGGEYAMAPPTRWTGGTTPRAGYFLQHDESGAVVFQHRVQPVTKWAARGSNESAPGVVNHEVCEAAVAEWAAMTDRRKSGWDSMSPCDQNAASTWAAGRWVLRRPHEPDLDVALLPGGTVDGIDAVWSVRDDVLSLGRGRRWRMTPRPRPPARGVCLTMDDAAMRDVGDLCHPPRASWCVRHGFDLVRATGGFDTTRPASWSKIPLVRDALRRYDVVLWMDADTLVTNPFAGPGAWPDEKTPLVMADHRNFGVFLIRSCDWSFRLLDAIWAQEDLVDSPTWENAAFERLWLSEQWVNSRVARVRAELFNVQPPPFFGESADSVWRPGDLLVHAAGVPALVKEGVLCPYARLTESSCGPGWEDVGTGTCLLPAPPRGFSIHAERASSDVFRGVYWENEYGLPERFDPSDIIVDIGAHVGSFAAACLVRGAGLVVCLEPNPANLAVLNRNFAGEKRCVVVGAAAWTSAGTLRLGFPVGAESSVGGSVTDADGETSVRAVSFDDVLRWLVHARLVKMDCEGAEFRLLSGCREWGRVREIVGEYHLAHNDKTRGDVEALLRAAGFVPETTENLSTIGWFRGTRGENNNPGAS